MATSYRSPNLTRITWSEFLYLAELAIRLVSWARGRYTAPVALKKAIALVIGIGYLGWFGLVTYAWGEITVSLAQNPYFFVSLELPKHALITVIFYVVMTGLPAVPARWLMDRLVPGLRPDRVARKGQFTHEWRASKPMLPAASVITQSPSPSSS